MRPLPDRESHRVFLSGGGWEAPESESVQKMRNARRQKFGQMAPASVYFQVLGNGAEGGPKSLFLFTSHNR